VARKREAVLAENGFRLNDHDERDFFGAVLPVLVPTDQEAGAGGSLALK
jgi:hypothetical protein